MITIDANEIDYLQVIGESKNKVLIIKQINSDRPVVVKSEETTTLGGHNNDQVISRNNVGAMLEFHGSMFSKLRSLPFDTARLTLNEISSLKACPPTKVRGLNVGETWPNVLETQVLTERGQIKSVVKISYIEQLANLSGMAKQLHQLNIMRNCLRHGDTGFVTQLGEILAVDFFIGNHDRFGETGKLRGHQNIFFQSKNGVVTATGIDTYDLFGHWSDLNKTIEELESTEANREKWPGRIFAHGAVGKRDVVATNAVEQIMMLCFEGILGHENVLPTDSNISSRRKKTLIKDFHKGMSEAKSTLRKKYSLSANHSGLLKGIASRWKIIRGHT